jgi:hypothetical protein
VLLSLFMTLLSGDTLRIRPAASAPAFDGVVTASEYEAPVLEMPTAQGGVRVWALRVADTVFLAARLRDSTFYWGDDLVISIDPLGDRTPGPGHDDTQWYIRRATDSSVVFQGRHGRWMPPGDDPDWRLGAARAEGGWELKTASDAEGWSVELRLPLEWFGDSTGRQARIAFRTYDDAPHAWYAWPEPQRGERPTVIERLPERWAVVELPSR